MIRRILSAAILVLLAIALLILAWPQLFGLDHAPLIAQAVSLRGAAIGVAAILIVLLILIALLFTSIRRFVASVAVLLLVFAGINGVVLADRGLGSIAFESPGATDLTVLSWNTLGDAPGADGIADLALEQGADILTLPETTQDMGYAVRDRMAEAGVTMQVFTIAFDQVSKARSTTLLVNATLGAYAIDEAAGSTNPLPSIVARPVSGVGPTIIAVHPVAPTAGELENWGADLDWLSRTCVGDNVIMGGDFNSTLDHFSRLDHADGATIGDCADAAKLSGNAGVGTWPTSIPALLGTPIDHVMLTDNWRVSGMRVIESRDGAGSDHRPLVVQLTPAG